MSILQNENVCSMSCFFLFFRHIFQKRNLLTTIFAKQIKKLQDQGLIAPNKRLVIHHLGHGRAVDLLENGMPIDILKEYLGHASLETTLFYTHFGKKI
ncbi:tyrosine-type recombinase/integrase [Methanococcus maripaludis]|uniref:Site-specific recombinase XerD n=1 Tax=Methanococcus maripaludis TaxID=39152 RepID=A0A8T4H0Y4_METMI|nr:tyrosine-type recombinase/integrase [Methanococcus maripaludis]MBP2219021.1 site-specific recombinase XerD [Methanococcus maripaludis]